MAVFLGRLVGQEVLDELHPLHSAERGDDERVAADVRLEPHVGARSPGVAISFGVRVGGRNVLVLVDLRPLDEAGGFLVEVHGGERRHRIPRLALHLGAPGQLLLVDARRIAPAAIVHHGQPYPAVDAIGGEVRRRVGAIAHQRVAAQGERLAGLRARLGVDEVHQAVHGVGAIAHGCRAAHNLDRLCGLVMYLEQSVDVAEHGGARRHAVLEDQERALPRAGRQNGRADGDQQFLARVHLHVDAGNCVQDFSRVIGGHFRDRFARHDRIGARVRLQAVAMDDHDVGIGRSRRGGDGHNLSLRRRGGRE